MRGIELRQTVSSLFEVVLSRSTAEELTFLCPQPGCGDKSGNRSVNLRSGKTNCWKCNKGGDFVLWAKALGVEITESGVQTSTGIEELRNRLDAPVVSRRSVPVISGIKLPLGFTRCADELDSVYTKLIGRMAVRKHLEPHDLIKAGVGFTRDGLWEPYAIFPVTELDRTVYYQGRTYTDAPGESTKRFPSRQEAPLSSRYWIYNVDALGAKGVTTAVVVESILNVLSLKKQFARERVTDLVPVCVFKHGVSREQAAKLGRFKNLREVCILFDHDATGLAWKTAEFLKSFWSMSVAEMLVGEGGNAKADPNDDVEAAMQALASRKNVGSSLTAFKYRLDGYGVDKESQFSKA